MTKAPAVGTVDVDTPVGPARLHVHRARGARALLVLGHGAGRGADTDDLLGLAADLPAHGVAVVLVDQPWVLAGRKVAAAPATLDRAWSPAVATARRAAGVRAATPLVVGGRSAGARVACRTSVETGASGVLLLAFPLLPPSAREGDRRAKALAARGTELAVPLDAGLPVVAAQGDRDAFGTGADLAAAAPRVVVHPVAGADHSFAVPKGAAAPGPALLVAALAAVGLATGNDRALRPR